MIRVDRADEQVMVEAQGKGYELITEAATAAVEVAQKLAETYKEATVNDWLELVAVAAKGIAAERCSATAPGGENPEKT